MWRAWILQGTWKEKALTNRLLSHRGTRVLTWASVPRKDHDGGEASCCGAGGFLAVVRPEPTRVVIVRGLKSAGVGRCTPQHAFLISSEERPEASKNGRIHEHDVLPTPALRREEKNRLFSGR